MIKTLIYNIDFNLDEDLLKDYLFLMPDKLKNQVMSYVQKEDRLRSLTGKLLLLIALKEVGLDHGQSKLDQIDYNEFKKPFFRNELNFNISHSGNYTVLSYSPDHELGIDIEKINEVDFSDFVDHFNKMEWAIIKSSANPTEEFFNRWTIKESVIKAEGKGLYIPLIDIDTSHSGTVIAGQRVWRIEEISIDPLYKSHIAVVKQEGIFEVESISKSRLPELLAL